MSNDHYVQRALMKAWSRRVPNKNDVVHYFDFSSGRVEEESTYELFAREGLNTPEIESRLGEIVESPLAKFRDYDMRLRKASPPASQAHEIKDWRILRAVALVFYVQSARALHALGHSDDVLSKLMTLPDGALDAIAQQFLSENHLASFMMPDGAELFLPEAGWYIFPARNGPTVYAWCRAIPLTPHAALVARPQGVPLTVDDETVASIASFSIGLSDSCRRVILSPKMIDTHGKEAIERTLPSEREKTKQTRDLVSKARALASEMYEMVGLPLPRSTV